MYDYIKQAFDHYIETGIIVVLGFFFKDRLISIGKKLFGHFFEKRVYKDAAKNEPLKTVGAMFDFSVIIFAIYFLFVGFDHWSHLSALNKEAERAEKIALENKGLKKCDECNPIKILKSAKDLQIDVFDRRINNISLIAASIGLLLIGFSRILRKAMVHEIQVEFKQDMNKIRPYIEDKEFHELNSWWAYMQNQADYMKIQTRIKDIETVLIKNKRNI